MKYSYDQARMLAEAWGGARAAAHCLGDVDGAELPDIGTFFKRDADLAASEHWRKFYLAA